MGSQSGPCTPTSTLTRGSIPRSQSGEQITWEQMDKHYFKLGRNGYRQKESRTRVRSEDSQESDDVFASGFQSLPDVRCDQNDGGAAGKLFSPAKSGMLSEPGTLREHEIVSDRGTVRGYKNRVRSGLATFFENIQSDEKVKHFRSKERNKIVIYTTNMAVVRATYDACKRVKTILQTHMLRYEEKDLFMSKENQLELRERLGTDTLHLPQVFADGLLIGSASEMEKLNESGELRQIFDNFTKINVRSSCSKCGGYRYVPCSSCHGSKRSLNRNSFTDEFCALRCMQCDENGLIRCDMCLDQQE